MWGLQSMLWMQGFGNLAVELRANFGWSKTLFSSAFSATRSAIAFLGPAVGITIARFGTTRVLRGGSVLVLIGFVGLSQIQTVLHFFVALSIAAIGMAFAGFITLTSALVQWFERRRAQALSLQTMGFAVGGFAGPLFVVAFGLVGWRSAVAGAGALIFLVGWFGAPTIGSDRSASSEPMDGLADPDATTTTRQAEGVSDRHFSTSNAVRTRAFWMVALGHGSALLVVTAVISHAALYLTEDRGFSAGEAALIAGLVPLFQFLGTGLGGYLGDRINKRIIIMVAMVMHATGLLALTWIESSITIAVFVVFHGLAWGARGPLMQAIRADYFGTTNFASIMGWSSIVALSGTVIGPLLAGVLADTTGNYRLGFTIIAVLALAGNGFWAFASPPPPHAIGTSKRVVATEA